MLYLHLIFAQGFQVLKLDIHNNKTEYNKLKLLNNSISAFYQKFIYVYNQDSWEIDNTSGENRYFFSDKHREFMRYTIDNDNIFNNFNEEVDKIMKELPFNKLCNG